MTKYIPVDYRDKKWYDKRREIIERDNHTCIRCNRQLSDDQLQVHHLHYFEDRKPWEYEDFELITLCKHCHAEEHGKIKPTTGWRWEEMTDLGDLVGECEYCNQAIRYAHVISHPDWGIMTVGRQCAEKLTSQPELSEYEERAKRLAQKYSRYINSPNWKNFKNGYFMDYDGRHIKIWSHITYFNLEIEVPLWDRNTLKLHFVKLSSKQQYNTLKDAKTKAFEVITDRSLIKYCEKHYTNDTPYEPIFDNNEYYD